MVSLFKMHTPVVHLQKFLFSKPTESLRNLQLCEETQMILLQVVYRLHLENQGLWLLSDISTAYLLLIITSFLLIAAPPINFNSLVGRAAIKTQSLFMYY